MTAKTITTRHRSRIRSLSLLAGLTTLAGIMGFAPQSDARLKSYYFLDGLSKVDTKPKILFVLDTSGSMTWITGKRKGCAFNQCEDPSATHASRMAVARDVIQSIVKKTSENADFSLMSFARMSPPSNASQVPDKCADGGRFRMVTYGDINLWVLCGTNRPFPYLRHDDLGSPSINQPPKATGALPESPMNKSAMVMMSLGRARSDQNQPNPRLGGKSGLSDNPFVTGLQGYEERKVQFFPDFLGVRVHFDSGLNLSKCSKISPTDPDAPMLFAVCRSFGDYGNNQENRRKNILGRDFYYWPYVDGFPGYSFSRAKDDDGIRHEMGVATNGSFPASASASLIAPFFLDRENGPVEVGEPASREAALNKVLAFTNPLISGGLDASGGTPWNNTIGKWVNKPKQSNAPFSHRSVASYVSYINSTQNTDGLCSPLSVILITDGEPNSTKHLYPRLADLRNKGKAETYVVGFGFGGSTLNKMACAAAGSTSSAPCSTGSQTITWNTCKDPKKPGSKCAYVADNKDELTERLSTIVTGALKLDLQSGPSTSVNEFGASATTGSHDTPDAIQTSVSAKTAWPGWRGTVKREICKDTVTDDTGATVPASHCDQTKLPFPDPNAETFGVCPLSRDWDAGRCLKNTNWMDRRLYFVAPNKELVRISDSGGQATTEFRALYDALYAAVAPDNAGTKPDADDFVSFILGKDWPDDYKLPGLAQSSPIVVRRIPQKNLNFRPTVPIRDPHCAGRKLGTAVNVPNSLEKFSDHAWDNSTKVGSNPHLPYQEAVLVGDDMGLLHAFHLDSGNEMWALLPHFALKSAIASYHHGPKNMGQPDKLDEHVFGMGGTINHAYVYQKPTDRNGNPTTAANPAHPGKWRHLAVIGMAQGGQELMALDLSHMSPHHPKGPVEVLWTSADETAPIGSTETLAQTYDRILGETWSRPAISYRMSSHSLNVEPSSILVLGSGYVDGSKSSSSKGKSYHVVDPLTGKILDSAKLPAATHPTYDNAISAASDVSVATHCSSRFWGEAEEAYFVDPGGRFYRWDLAADTDHSGDSVRKWSGAAQPVVTFKACQGKADFSCAVESGNKGDPFHFAPAVVSNNRIDDELAGGLSGIAADQKDNFLVALISGHLLDKTTDASQKDADFHPSVYLIADDHRGNKNHEGFSIPEHGAITPAGTHKSFFRLPLSQLRRDRKYVPYPGAEPIVEVNQPFSRRARPIAAPRITVTGLSDKKTGEIRKGVEVVYVEFNIFEPGINSCDSRLYDPKKKKHYQDPGSSYIVRLRLISDDQDGFDFQSGSSKLGNTMGADRYGFTRNGLQVGTVEQLKDDCESGGCGPKMAQKKFRPCVPENKFSQVSSGSSVGLGYKVLEGFSPIEYNTKADKG